jgi:large subunit ribosomal protein L24
MKIRKDDKVKIITGKDKGKEGKVLKVLKEEQKIVVEGVNVVKKHVKPGSVGQNKEGGIVSIEKPIAASNVMFLDDESGQPIRLGYKIIDGKKYRINKKTEEVIEK